MKKEEKTKEYREAERQSYLILIALIGIAAFLIYMFMSGGMSGAYH